MFSGQNVPEAPPLSRQGPSRCQEEETDYRVSHRLHHVSAWIAGPRVSMDFCQIHIRAEQKYLNFFILYSSHFFKKKKNVFEEIGLLPSCNGNIEERSG